MQYFLDSGKHLSIYEDLVSFLLMDCFSLMVISDKVYSLSWEATALKILFAGCPSGLNQILTLLSGSSSRFLVAKNAEEFRSLQCSANRINHLLISVRLILLQFCFLFRVSQNSVSQKLLRSGGYLNRQWTCVKCYHCWGSARRQKLELDEKFRIWIFQLPKRRLV